MSRIFSFLSLGFLLALLMTLPLPTVAQTDLAGVCPAACGIKIRITSATLTEANDGMLVNVEWTLEQSAPEIKLQTLQVFARVKLGIDKVENTVSVPATSRKVTLKLSRRLEFDLKDVEALTTKVTATALALPPIPVTNITSRKIIEDGRNSAVEVAWGNPGPLPCSANTFQVNVAATNEKGDKLKGIGSAPPSARSARVELKGEINKKGLHNPEATVTLFNNLIECVELKNTSNPVAVVPRDNSGQTKVTLKPITFQDFSGRIDIGINWDVVEPPGFKATRFDFKIDSELGNGKIASRNSFASANDRSLFGIQAQTGDFRGVTVTVKATFSDTANTIVVTREDTQKQTFNSKAGLVQAKPVSQPPQPPQAQTIGLDVTNVKVNTTGGVHSVATAWQVNVPARVTVTSFEVEAAAAGNQSKAKRSVVLLGTARQATINFAISEVGTTLNNAQIKVTANARRADGSTFQQTATRNSN